MTNDTIETVAPYSEAEIQTIAQDSANLDTADKQRLLATVLDSERIIQRLRGESETVKEIIELLRGEIVELRKADRADFTALRAEMAEFNAKVQEAYDKPHERLLAENVALSEEIKRLRGLPSRECRLLTQGEIDDLVAGHKLSAKLQIDVDDLRKSLADSDKLVGELREALVRQRRRVGDLEGAMPPSADMTHADGPKCWCGSPSTYESGWCGTCAGACPTCKGSGLVASRNEYETELCPNCTRKI